MRVGYIKWFSYEKKYGFITSMDESGEWNEIFVHRTALDFHVRPGDFVQFYINYTPEGPIATCVHRAKIEVL